MVSVSYSFFAIVLSFAGVNSQTVEDIDNLPVGTYFRPAQGDFSGVYQNTAKFSRTPCPALNSLANHGYISRTGKNVSKKDLEDAVVQVLNIDRLLAKGVTASLPETFNLDFLGQHGLVEHDASIVHDDAFLGNDPAAVNATLVSQLLSRASNGKIGIKEIAAFRKHREAECKATNPEYSLNLFQDAVSVGEATLLLTALGDKETKTISVEHAESFLLNEKFPEGWTKAKSAINVLDVASVSTKIKATAILPWTRRD